MKLAILLLGTLLLLPLVTIQAAEPTRPNILFIIADDQSPMDLSAYNPQTSLQTPVLDKLAAEGMVFDSAYHMGAFQGAVCTPSRHMIMSGRTVWHLPIGPGAKAHCPPDLEQNTIPAVFNRAGYATMRTCKNGNSYEAANKLFTVRHDASKLGGTEETGSAWHAEQVLSYLHDRETTHDTKPFLIYFGFSHPHDTRDGTTELLAKYGAVNHTDRDSLPPANVKQPPLPANYLPAHPFPDGHPGLRDEVAVSGVWEKRDPQTIRNEIGRYDACSENIDIQIGRVLEKLDAMGELDNTYIFYTADHGIAVGRHGLQGKQNLYEHTWRVPFIVKGPGIQPSSRAPGNIYLLDTLATLCDLAGIEAPDSNEGISFKSVLEGKQAAIRDVVYGTYCGGTKPGMRSVRQGDWKLIEYDVLNGAVREKQLFNLAENPHEYLAEHHAPSVIALTGVTPEAEQTNLAGDPRYADELAEMEALLLAEMRRLDDPYRLWHQPTDGLTSPAKPAQVKNESSEKPTVEKSNEKSVQPLPKLSDEQITELTQVGDRLADQGDYQGALENYTRAYQGVVTRLRGQAFVRAVQPSIFNRQQLGVEMLKLIEQEYTPDELELMDLSYKVFGFVPPQLDSTALMTAMLTEEVAGFYDPDHKRMVLIVEDAPSKPPSWLGSLLGAKQAFDKDEQKTTLVHELTHALQDQLYDLNAMEKGIEKDDDMLLAFSALVEGDATLLMFAEASDEQDITKMDPVAMRAMFNIMSWMMPLAGGKTFRSAPAIFRDSLTFPYFQGMLFVLAVAGEDGWEGVHQAFSNPPRSTEQILHPDKYLREIDIPQEVILPDVSDLLPTGWAKLGGNCLGELQTSILLKRVPGGGAAAAGWDGDRYEVFRNADGKLGLVYASVWDSVEDANEFAEAYLSYRQLSAKPAGEQPATQEQPQRDAERPASLGREPLNETNKGAEATKEAMTDPTTEAALLSVFADDAHQELALGADQKVWIVEGFPATVSAQIAERVGTFQCKEKLFPRAE